MKTFKAIIIGGFIWILGSSFYTASYFLPFLEDVELQANLVLAVAIIPNAWLGAHLFYKWEHEMSGFRFGIIALVSAISLDALITVPWVIIPMGGTYLEFFSAPAFWLIAAEYFLIIVIYWNLKVKPQLKSIES